MAGYYSFYHMGYDAVKGKGYGSIDKPKQVIAIVHNSEGKDYPVICRYDQVKDRKNGVLKKPEFISLKFFKNFDYGYPIKVSLYDGGSFEYIPDPEYLAEYENNTSLTWDLDEDTPMVWEYTDKIEHTKADFGELFSQVDKDEIQEWEKRSRSPIYAEHEDFTCITQLTDLKPYIDAALNGGLDDQYYNDPAEETNPYYGPSEISKIERDGDWIKFRLLNLSPNMAKQIFEVLRNDPNITLDPYRLTGRQFLGDDGTHYQHGIGYCDYRIKVTNGDAEEVLHSVVDPILHGKPSIRSKSEIQFREQQKLEAAKRGYHYDLDYSKYARLLDPNVCKGKIVIVPMAGSWATSPNSTAPVVGPKLKYGLAGAIAIKYMQKDGSNPAVKALDNAYATKQFRFEANQHPKTFVWTAPDGIIYAFMPLIDTYGEYVENPKFPGDTNKGWVIPNHKKVEEASYHHAMTNFFQDYSKLFTGKNPIKGFIFPKDEHGQAPHKDWIKDKSDENLKFSAKPGKDAVYYMGASQKIVDETKNKYGLGKNPVALFDFEEDHDDEPEEKSAVPLVPVKDLEATVQDLKAKAYRMYPNLSVEEWADLTNKANMAVRSKLLEIKLKEPNIPKFVLEKRYNSEFTKALTDLVNNLGTMLGKRPAAILPRSMRRKEAEPEEFATTTVAMKAYDARHTSTPALDAWMMQFKEDIAAAEREAQANSVAEASLRKTEDLFPGLKNIYPQYSPAEIVEARDRVLNETGHNLFPLIKAAEANMYAARIGDITKFVLATDDKKAPNQLKYVLRDEIDKDPSLEGYSDAAIALYNKVIMGEDDLDDPDTRDEIIKAYPDAANLLMRVFETADKFIRTNKDLVLFARSHPNKDTLRRALTDYVLHGGDLEYKKMKNGGQYVDMRTLTNVASYVSTHPIPDIEQIQIKYLATPKDDPDFKFIEDRYNHAQEYDKYKNVQMKEALGKFHDALKKELLSHNPRPRADNTIKLGSPSLLMKEIDKMVDTNKYLISNSGKHIRIYEGYLNNRTNIALDEAIAKNPDMTVYEYLVLRDDLYEAAAADLGIRIAPARSKHLKRKELISNADLPEIFNGKTFKPVPYPPYYVATQRDLHSMEISSASSEEVGRELSAQSMPININGELYNLESVYQGDKVIDGKSDPSLYTKWAKGARYTNKRRGSIQGFNNPVGYKFNSSDLPRTAYYDFLYIQALADMVKESPDLMTYLASVPSFTDRFGAPNKACQARSLAMFMGLRMAGKLDEVLTASSADVNGPRAFADLVYDKGMGDKVWEYAEKGIAAKDIPADLTAETVPSIQPAPDKVPDSIKEIIDKCQSGEYTYHGDLSLLGRPAVACIGNRDLTENDPRAKSAQKVLRAIESSGAIIVSGGAKGADSIAISGHQLPTIRFIPEPLGTPVKSENGVTTYHMADGSFKSFNSNDLVICPLTKQELNSNLSYGKKCFIRDRFISKASNSVFVLKCDDPDTDGTRFACQQAQLDGKPIFTVPGNDRFAKAFNATPINTLDDLEFDFASPITEKPANERYAPRRTPRSNAGQILTLLLDNLGMSPRQAQRFVKDSNWDPDLAYSRLKGWMDSQGRSKELRDAASKARLELKAINNGGAHLLTIFDPEFNPNWAQGETPRTHFTVMGDPSLLRMRQFGADGSDVLYDTKNKINREGGSKTPFDEENLRHLKAVGSYMYLFKTPLDNNSALNGVTTTCSNSAGAAAAMEASFRSGRKQVRYLSAPMEEIMDMVGPNSVLYQFFCRGMWDPDKKAYIPVFNIDGSCTFDDIYDSYSIKQKQVVGDDLSVSYIDEYNEDMTPMYVPQAGKNKENFQKVFRNVFSKVIEACNPKTGDGYIHFGKVDGVDQTVRLHPAYYNRPDALIMDMFAVMEAQKGNVALVAPSFSKRSDAPPMGVVEDLRTPISLSRVVGPTLDGQAMAGTNMADHGLEETYTGTQLIIPVENSSSAVGESERGTSRFFGDQRILTYSDPENYGEGDYNPRAEIVQRGLQTSPLQDAVKTTRTRLKPMFLDDEDCL